MQRAGLNPVGASPASVKTDSSGKFTALVGTDGKDVIIISSAAPSASDGRADGTIYIQVPA